MYENSLTYQLVVYIIYDFFNIVGMEPHDILIPLEPCLLFTTVASAIALYVEYTLIDGYKSIKIFEGLLVAYRVQ